MFLNPLFCSLRMNVGGGLKGAPPQNLTDVWCGWDYLLRANWRDSDAVPGLLRGWKSADKQPSGLPSVAGPKESPSVLLVSPASLDWAVDRGACLPATFILMAFMN